MTFKISVTKTAKAFWASVLIHLGVLAIVVFSLNQSPESIQDWLQLEFVTVSQPKLNQIRRPPTRVLRTKKTLPSLYSRSLTPSLNVPLSQFRAGISSRVSVPSPHLNVTFEMVDDRIQIEDALESHPLRAVNSRPIFVHHKPFKKRESLQESEYWPVDSSPILGRFLADTVSSDNAIFRTASQDLLRLIGQRIRKHQRYPRWAQQAGYEGAVEIQFSLLPTGKIGPVDIIRSSGYNILDQSAVTAVKKATPFPTDLLDLNPTYLSVRLTIKFSLLNS